MAFSAYTLNTQPANRNAFLRFYKAGQTSNVRPVPNPFAVDPCLVYALPIVNGQDFSYYIGLTTAETSANFASWRLAAVDEQDNILQDNIATLQSDSLDGTQYNFYFSFTPNLPVGATRLAIYLPGTPNTMLYRSNHIRVTSDNSKLSELRFRHYRNYFGYRYEPQNLLSFENIVWLDIYEVGYEPVTDGAKYREGTTGNFRNYNANLDFVGTFKTMRFDKEAHKAMHVVLAHDEFDLNGQRYMPDSEEGYSGNTEERRKTSEGIFRAYEYDYAIEEKNQTGALQISQPLGNVGLSITENASRKPVLTWTYINNTPAQFEIWRSPSSGSPLDNGTLLFTTAEGASTYTDATATTRVLYWYSVRATNEFGTGAFTTLPFIAMTAPTNLRVGSVNTVNSIVQLLWDYTPTGYTDEETRVYNDGAQIGDRDAGQTSFTTAFNISTVYNYTVRSRLRRGGVTFLSPDSNTVTFGNGTTDIPNIYHGMAAANADAATIQAFTSFQDVRGNYLNLSYTGTNQRFYIAFPDSYGLLDSVLDQNGFEIIAGFSNRAVTFTESYGNVDYRIYEYQYGTTQISFELNFYFP